MLIGHVRWIGLLANVWCSNHSEFLCRGLLIDVPRHGVASAANVVYGRHYTGCVDDGKASRVLVDAF